MPLKLVPPSKDRRTPYFTVRGTYLRVHVDRSTKASERRQANKILKGWEQQIERGEYGKTAQVEEAPPAEKTFAGAAIAYMNAGGERRFLAHAINELGRLALSKIDQEEIDAAAVRAFPKGTAAYRNRNFYTPVSAVLKHVGAKREIKRPKGWRGKRHTTWLEPDQAFALFKAADDLDAEFGLLLRTLCYTGMRLGEALNVRLRHVRLDRQTIYLPETKNGEARPVYLPPRLVTALANHPRGLGRDADAKLFPHAQPAQAGQECRRNQAAAAPGWLPHALPHLGHLDAPLWQAGYLRPGRHGALEGPSVGAALRAHGAGERCSPGSTTAGRKTAKEVVDFTWTLLTKNLSR